MFLFHLKSRKSKNIFKGLVLRTGDKDQTYIFYYVTISQIFCSRILFYFCYGKSKFENGNLFQVSNKNVNNKIQIEKKMT